ncbi:MAG: cation-translocating P-type ATPase, partial [Candidatus Thiodiazotropha sp. (ex Ctena orbiculata)]|nr:cation-translocating P-type ATPase [Candidatus Thiodiazotropha taylori]
NRDGIEEFAYQAEKLVTGDLVLLEAGDMVPADLRLISGIDLRLDEAALTGESVPVEKQTTALTETDLPLADRSNMAYKGTLVSNGRGTGLVIATGIDTELGQIATLLKHAKKAKTPLQQRLSLFGQRLGILVVAICVLIFLVGILRGEQILLMFLTAVSLAVAAIPEALPAVVTIALALGARRMVLNHALAKRLPAVETLGSVTYICSDKTGTLTQNRMRVRLLFADGKLNQNLSVEDASPWHQLALAMTLNCDAAIDERGNPTGDPTEVALLKTTAKIGLSREKLEQKFPRINEIPFDAQRKCMTTCHLDQDNVLCFTKGAPEKLLSQCHKQLGSSGTEPLNRSVILEQAETMALDGYRVLAFAFRIWAELPEDPTAEKLESGLTFLGLAALFDPPRPEVKQAVDQCRTAGIIPVMITGDHPITARAIARQLMITDNSDGVLTGDDIERMTEQQLIAAVNKVQIYARMTPEQKINIVRALQHHGEFVAMTGDGVNDAPALKRANIGIAMGIKGTDVAREASDMVLLDDNFASIVQAVRDGRRIYDNIRKFIKYTMTSNSGEIWTLFLAPFLGLPLPLLPIQILWINLVTDGLPGLALAMEREERGIMHRAPRPPHQSIFAHGMWQHMLWIGLLIGGLSLYAQSWAYHRGSENWQTVVFTVLTLSQMVHALAIRSTRDSLFSIGIFSNGYLIGAIALTLLMQMGAIYLDWMQFVLKTTALTQEELILCLTLPWVVLLAVEAEKWLVRHGWIYRQADQNGAVGRKTLP